MKDIMSYEFQQLPAGPFEIIYADPPWSYGNCQFAGSRITSSADFHYPTVSVKDLKKLDIRSIAEDNCLLFMWTSSPHLDQAIDLGRAWGFQYKTIAFVWDKQKVNPGAYTLSQCEVCLVSKRGKIPQPRGERNVRQFLTEMRTEHSAKPHEIRDRIERMFPFSSKIELFARSPINGWDTWGNQGDGQAITLREEEVARHNDSTGRRARKHLQYRIEDVLS